MRMRFRPIAVPDRGVHPAVRRLFDEMNRQQLGVLDLAERSGLNKNTIMDWRKFHVPNVINLDAALNAVGLTLAVQHAHDR